MKKERVELHCHTCMSRMNGISSVDDILAFAKKNDMKSIAFTDHNSILAYPEIRRLTKSRYKEIKPIYGVELLVTEDILSQTEAMSKVRFDGLPSYYVLVLVKNETGLKNLYRILSEACTKEYKHPRIAWSRLLEMREGLLVGSACAVGELFHSIMQGISEDILREMAARYDFLEIQPATNDSWLLQSEKAKDITCMEDVRKIQQRIMEIGKEAAIPVVATSDSHFLTSENALSRRILLNAKGWGDEPQGDLFIRTTEEMLEEFSFLPKEKAYEIVVTNTNRLADMIEPIVPVPECKYVVSIEDADLKLKMRCEKALMEKYRESRSIPKKVLDRMNQELQDIAHWGFAEKYLHYAEIITRHNLRPSQYGLKGHGASSMVSYLLGISKEDPLSEECPLYVELFSALKGNKEPDFELTVDERAWKQIRESLAYLDGVEEAVEAASFVNPSDSKVESWIDAYEKDISENIVESARALVFQDLKNVVTVKGRRMPGKFFIVPNGKSELLPKERDANNMENVYQLRWRDMDHIFGVYDIDRSKQRAFLCRMEEESGRTPADEEIRNQEMIKDICSVIEYSGLGENIGVWKNITKYYEPDSFIDIVRIISLAHGIGVWEENGGSYIASGTVAGSDVISNCEDIYEMLLAHGMTKEKAFEITEYICKGKMYSGKTHPEYAEEMMSYGVPEWFVESCKRIQYLSSRAQSAERAQLILRLLFFKKYYAEMFDRIYFEMF